MRRLLIVGAEIPNFPHIEWKDWGFANPLDYQGLLLDCREPQSLPNHSSIASVLQTLVASGHTAYILLPEARNLPSPPGQMLIVPSYFLFAEQAFGQTLNIVANDPFFQTYRSALAGHEICFRFQQMNNTAALVILNGIVDNVARLVCAKVASIYLLHPPSKKLEQKAFKAIVEHFGPDPVPISSVPKPSWLDQAASTIPGVATIQAARASISAEIQEKNKLLETQDEKLRKLSSWADLLWLDGIPLQDKVAEALKLVGIDILSDNPTGHTGDLRADESGIEYVFEVTGSTGSIGIDKGRQLLQWTAEAKDPASAKGVLIANAFRNHPPSNRPPTPDHKIFVSELEQFAQRYHLALLDVRELYRAVCLELENKGIDKATILATMSGAGVVRFP